jgi:hypothetical protein
MLDRAGLNEYLNLGSDPEQDSAVGSYGPVRGLFIMRTL